MISFPVFLHIMNINAFNCLINNLFFKLFFFTFLYLLYISIPIIPIIFMCLGVCKWFSIVVVISTSIFVFFSAIVCSSIKCLNPLGSPIILLICTSHGLENPEMCFDVLFAWQISARWYLIVHSTVLCRHTSVLEHDGYFRLKKFMFMPKFFVSILVKSAI